MNKMQTALVFVVVVASITSMAGAYPLTNIVLNDNDAGWFTVDNIEEYGDDLDDRVAPGDTIFTGHPAYVMESQNAHMLFDMPRVHFFALTFKHTPPGNDLNTNLTRAFETGEAKYAVSGPMTVKILELNQTVKQAFVNHYCRVDTGGLYEKTDAQLYKWVPNSTDCPPDRRPDVENMSVK